MTRSKLVVSLAALLLIAAPEARAQARANSFQVVAQGGYTMFAEGSALTGTATLGVDATYFLTPSFGLGIWTDYSFGESDGEMFDPIALSFVDTTTFTRANQPVEVWQYGAHAKLQLAGRSVAPFLILGGGGYSVFLDPQQNNAAETETGFVARFGVGVDFALSETAGIQLAVTDAFMPDWDPQALFPARDEFRNSRFPELNPDPDDLSESVHNFRFSAGVTYVPGGR